MSAGVAARAVALTGADQVISDGPAFYRGFSLRNTSASAVATVRIHNHPSSASGSLLDAVEVAAGESAREWYGGVGIFADAGIFVDVVAGAVEGSVRVG